MSGPVQITMNAETIAQAAIASALAAAADAGHQRVRSWLPANYMLTAPVAPAPEPAPDEPAPKRPRAASELSGGPYKRPKGRAPGGKLWDSHAGQWVLPTDEPAEPYAPAAGEWPAAYDDDVGEAAEALGEPVGDDEISPRASRCPRWDRSRSSRRCRCRWRTRREADAEEEADEGASCDGRTTRRCDCASS